MIASALILAFLAGNSLVEAVPAKKVSTFSYPETITIHPPTTTETLVWPDGFLSLPGTTQTITSTLGLPPHLQAHETAEAAPEETVTATLPFEEPVSALSVPIDDTQPSDIFLPIEVTVSANFSATANRTQVSLSPIPTVKVIEPRAPLPEKTVFVTITKEPAKPSSTKPKQTQSTWTKGKHCPYPYPGERCSPPKSGSKSTKTSSSIPIKMSGPKKPCPYPGQDC